MQFTTRTANSELFINPLMALYFTFDLPGLAKQSHYLHLLEHTDTMFEVSATIEGFRRGVPHTRPRRAIPH
ncbi:MAG: hypothetical protein KC776_37650 [Myxococcales bacterium]|nr:hypothetical protein [Myxococcales bacterium]